MLTEIGWKFPSTGGGPEFGINDAGIVTYDGSPLSSLAREVIQNSVDERQSEAKPVRLHFVIRRVPLSAFAGAELADHIDQCLAYWPKDDKAQTILQTARDLLQADHLDLLGIIDENTGGLHDDKWRMLVKMNGASHKESAGSAGSFGVGKAAPFAVSPLRTVFYWSAFPDCNGELQEQFQGKAVLASHKYDYEDGQGEVTTINVGYYGATDNCEPVNEHIPSKFRHLDADGNPVQGTAIWVGGFDRDHIDGEEDGGSWQHAIKLSVVENYFYAIGNGDLEVTLEPPIGSKADDREWRLNRHTLAYHFDQLAARGKDESEIDEQVERSRLYWELMDGAKPTDEMKQERHGIKGAKLWIGTEASLPGRELPNRVALIRKGGMLITDEQQRFRFRNLQDYAAVCLIEDPASNALLKKMENPRHDQFEHERIAGHQEREQGKRALESLREWIRLALKEAAPIEQPPVNQELQEMLQFLWTEDDGALPNEESLGVVQDVIKKPKSVRRITWRGEEVEEIDDDEEAGGGSGPGKRKKKKRTTTRNVGPLLEVENVRFVPDPQDPRRAELRFQATENGAFELKVEEAGDERGIPRDDVTCTFNGKPISEDHPEQLERGERYVLYLKGEAPLHQAAWQVNVREQK